MPLYYSRFTVPSECYDALKQDLANACIVHSTEEDGLESFLLPGARVKIRVPPKEEIGKTDIHIIRPRIWLSKYFNPLRDILGFMKKRGGDFSTLGYKE